jgi:hypothetical protein
LEVRKPFIPTVMLNGPGAFDADLVLILKLRRPVRLVGQRQPTLAEVQYLAGGRRRREERRGTTRLEAADRHYLIAAEDT